MDEIVLMLLTDLYQNAINENKSSFKIHISAISDCTNHRKIVRDFAETHNLLVEDRSDSYLIFHIY